MKYLELFAKALGMIPKDLERSRYELETNQSPLAEDRGREMDSESNESPEQEEDSTPEPQEGKVKNFRLSCTCGSWGHQCEEEEHDCPTNCLVYIDMDSLGDIVPPYWESNKVNHECGPRCLHPAEHLSSYLRGLKATKKGTW